MRRGPDVLHEPYSISAYRFICQALTWRETRGCRPYLGRNTGVVYDPTLWSNPPARTS
jgi:hypothetical protein